MLHLLPKKEIENLLVDLVFSLSLSGLIAKIMPEIVHAVATIVTGLALTTLVFFLNRWLRSTFPENRKSHESKDNKSR